MVYFFSFFFQSQDGGEDQFQMLFVLHLSTMVLVIGILAGFVSFLYKTDQIPNEKKSLWAIILFMGNMFAFPVFWYLYIWKGSTKK